MLVTKPHSVYHLLYSLLNYRGFYLLLTEAANKVLHVLFYVLLLEAELLHPRLNVSAEVIGIVKRERPVAQLKQTVVKLMQYRCVYLFQDRLGVYKDLFVYIRHHCPIFPFA